MEKEKLNIHAVISRYSFEEFYMGKISQESIDEGVRAFNALVAYENNCRTLEAKSYDGRIKIPKDENMESFAMKYRTTTKEMKKCWPLIKDRFSNGL